MAVDILRKSMLLAEQLEQLASIDPLSDLAVRRAFTDAGQRAIVQAGRSGSGCATLMIDVDHFKAINDRFGHTGGDKVIAGLGALLSDSCDEPATLQDLLTRADAALYQPKSDGCDRVEAEAPRKRTPPTTEREWRDSASVLLL